MKKYGAVLFLLASCASEDGPTGPEPIGGAQEASLGRSTVAVDFVSTFDGSATLRVDVLANGIWQQTGTGTMEIPLFANAPIEIVAEGFLTRHMLFPGEERVTIDLIPKTTETGVTEADIQSLMYWFGHAYENSVPHLLMRMRPGPVSVVLADELRNNAVTYGVFGRGVEELNELTDGVYAYRIEEEGTSSGTVVRVIDDPDHDIFREFPDAAGVAILEGANGFTHAATIVFHGGCCEKDNFLMQPRIAVPLVIHELGHTFGFGHSVNQRDAMCAGTKRCGLINASLDGFSPREMTVARFMMARRPGTQYPDDERFAGTFGTALRTGERFKVAIP